MQDVERTFPGHPYFESAKGLESLRRVLSAFAVHNADIGYCQSINFVTGASPVLFTHSEQPCIRLHHVVVARFVTLHKRTCARHLSGFLLLLLPEESAFWCLDVLVNEILPPDYYSHTLAGVHAGAAQHLM